MSLTLRDLGVGFLATAGESSTPTRGNRLSRTREGWQPSSSRIRGVCGVLPGTNFAFSGTRYLLFQERSFQSRPFQPFYPEKSWLSLICLELCRPCLYVSYMRANDEHDEACALVVSDQQTKASAAASKPPDVESFEKGPGTSCPEGVLKSHRVDRWNSLCRPPTISRIFNR